MKKVNCLILSLILLMFAGVGAIFANNAYAATVGEQLIQPEEGWIRFNAPDSKIYQGGFTITNFDKDAYNGAINYDGSSVIGRDIEFTFYGTKLRLYYGALKNYNLAENVQGIISFDNGKTWERIDENFTNYVQDETLFYEKENLEPEVHDVKVKIFNVSNNPNGFVFNGFDTDEDGELLEFGCITINKNNLELVKNEQEKISCSASLRISSDKLVWSSSDESVATVEKGLVTAVGKGEATIKVSIEGTNLIRNCKVTVTNVPKVEDGWTRFDGTNSKIIKISFYGVDLDSNSYDANIDMVQDNAWGKKIRFSFYGTKLRLYFDNLISENAEGVISFDNGRTWEKFDPSTQNQAMVYKKENLEPEVHDVFINVFYDNKFSFECFDIDEDGELLELRSFFLNKNELKLKINESEDLKVSLKDSNFIFCNEVWSSSDESVATVDKKGLVTAIGAGETNITLKIEGTNYITSCKVVVTDEDEILTDTANDEETVVDEDTSDEESIAQEDENVSDEEVSLEEIVDEEITDNDAVTEEKVDIDNQDTVTEDATDENISNEEIVEVTLEDVSNE